MNNQKPINKPPKLTDHIKTAKLDPLAFSGEDFIVDSLDKLASCFTIVYDTQQSQWTAGTHQKAELMDAMREWICYNFHKNKMKTVAKFLLRLSPDLRQRFLLNICEGFDDFSKNRSVTQYTGVKEACIRFVKIKPVFNDFFLKPSKNWNCFQAYPGNYLLYAVLGGMKKIANILVEYGFYEYYFDNLLTLPGDPQNIVEQLCKENEWNDIVAKLCT